MILRVPPTCLQTLLACVAAALLATPVVGVDPVVLEAEARRVEVIRVATDTAVAIFAGSSGGGSGCSSPPTAMP